MQVDAAWRPPRPARVGRQLGGWRPGDTRPALGRGARRWARPRHARHATADLTHDVPIVPHVTMRVATEPRLAGAGHPLRGVAFGANRRCQGLPCSAANRLATAKAWTGHTVSTASPCLDGRRFRIQRERGGAFGPGADLPTSPCKWMRHGGRHGRPLWAGSWADGGPGHPAGAGAPSTTAGRAAAREAREARDGEPHAGWRLGRRIARTVPLGPPPQ